MSSIRTSLSLTAAALTTLLATTALGQPKADGFSLNRFEPSDRGSEWFTTESLDMRGDMRFAGGLVLDYGRKPLVLYDTDGEERSAIVENQLFGHVGASMVLRDRFRLGLSLPVAIWQNGDGGSTGAQTFESNNSTTIGDARLTGAAAIVMPLVAVACVGLVTATAYYGGQLVYELGVNVVKVASSFRSGPRA